MGTREILTVHVLVSGRVQGVAYRASLAAEASRLRINGFVRNLSDGRVEYVAQGPADAVKELMSWSREGPRFASVTHFESAEIDDPPVYSTFGIEPTR